MQLCRQLKPQWGSNIILMGELWLMFGELVLKKKYYSVVYFFVL